MDLIVVDGHKEEGGKIKRLDFRGEKTAPEPEPVAAVASDAEESAPAKKSDK